MHKCDLCEQEIPSGQPFVEVRHVRHPDKYSIGADAPVLVGRTSTYCSTCQKKVLKS